MQAAIYGLEGIELKPEDRDFFRDADPAGYILFRRNCEDRAQRPVFFFVLWAAARGLTV